ncbi:MAG: 23S rRNA (adenine(2030)-N(6))-methyltransferase RlmJ [Pseudorhodoplanes sp.]|nr:23S rRNA (adenine(2030)-N(6))-methyltransferase RlmJ [Pseudorhodoplanes sp.]
MNYRHAFHAGNFADVVKHAILWRILSHLRKKDAPFRVIDTHAGTGVYDLQSPEAVRNPEWRGGIGRILADDLRSALPPDSDLLLSGYLDAVRAQNPGGRLRFYPGSPELVRAALRRDDRLIACEAEPGTAAALARRYRGDRQVKTIAIDGWTALRAYIPPRERRGLVLVDPPFEQPDELSRLGESLVAAARKWPTGIFLAWYPVKNDAEVGAFMRTLWRSGIEKLLRVELLAESGAGTVGLRGSGQIIVNPPWTLDEDLRAILPILSKRLNAHANDPPRIEWIGGARANSALRDA